MFINRHLIFLLLCCLPFLLRAQQQGSVKGVLFKAGSSSRIAQAVISNPRTGSMMMSDELGVFSIKASRGDTLLITKKGFNPIKQPVISLNDMAIFLEPGNIELEEVKITGQSKKKELNDIMGSYRSQGTFFNGKPPALLFLNSPITGLYELFGATPRRARHFAAFSRAELEQDAVNRRYNKDFVMRITGLPDAEAQKFMDQYSPSYEDLAAWNDYELIKRVKRQYEYFKKNTSRSDDLFKQQRIRVDTSAAPVKSQ